MKKKWWIIAACAGIAVVIIAFSIGQFCYNHPTHYKYNDRFVLGNTAENITEEYGPFSKISRNKEGQIVCAWYMIRENTPEMIMSRDNSLWYEIHFRDGIATQVRLQEGWYGG